MKQMRIRFRLLTLVVIGLLALASVYGVYSVSTYGNRWFSSARNTRYQTAKKSVVKGDIFDRYGVVLATTDENGDRVYQSDVRRRSSIVHLIGDAEGYIANGVDSFQASYLLGFETSLAERVKDLLNGEVRRGDDVTLTVDSRLCTEIVSYFHEDTKTRGKNGAAVVMNYRTGEVLAMVSLPIFDPANLTEQVKESPQHPFWNRALQSTLPPGSIFKIITAASMLKNIPEAQTQTFICTGALEAMGHVIHDYGRAKHGEETLENAFRQSCNNIFAQCALHLGDTALRRTAEEFGFNDNFLFRDFVVQNSQYPTKNRNDFEIAWSGAGQSQIMATPMHMCMMASAIANGGTMMEPRLLAQVTSPAQTARLRFTQKVYTRACDASVATILDGYMKKVVSNGTGTAARVNGLTIAGKTGSAETSMDGKYVTHAWFVGYIADPALPYACAVLVEDGDTGGSMAAPIAARIFKYASDYYRK